MTDTPSASQPFLPLVARARAGDSAAFAELVSRFQGMALAYALSLLGSEAEAGDAVQEAFIDAYLRLGQLRHDAAFPGWLRRVVHKHCDRLTRRRRPETDEETVNAQPGQSAAAPELLERIEERERLRRAIEALPEHERIVVALHYLGERPQAEVADFLEVPLTTVKKRLHTARGRLRDLSETRRTQAPDPDGLAAPALLFLAIRAGEQVRVEALLDRHPELLESEESWTDEEALRHELPLAHRVTPLVLAAGRGHREIVERLLARGASVEGRCGCANGETAIWAAVRSGSRACAAALLAAGADPNRANRAGQTPLHVAAQRRDEPMQALLRAHGALERRDAEGRTPLDWSRRVRDSAPAEPLESGIKALELFAPLAAGDIVQVHAAAETGLMVLLAELSHNLAPQAPVRWVSWERGALEGELAGLVGESGIDVPIVAGPDPLGAALDLPGEPILVLFEAEGRAAEIEMRLPELRAHARVVFWVRPWIPITRGDLGPPSLCAPVDALVLTDPELVRAGCYPAIATASRRRDSGPIDGPAGLASRARELLETDARDAQSPRFSRRAALLRAYLTQPFFVAEHMTGWPGEHVRRADLLREVEEILAGDHDERTPEELLFRGSLSVGIEGSRPRVPPSADLRALSGDDA